VALIAVDWGCDSKASTSGDGGTGAGENEKGGDGCVLGTSSGCGVALTSVDCGWDSNTSGGSGAGVRGVRDLCVGALRLDDDSDCCVAALRRADEKNCAGETPIRLGAGESTVVGGRSGWPAGMGVL